MNESPHSSPTPSSLDPDAQLMLRVRDDDASAYEELINKYQGSVIRLMQSWTNDRDLAEDLAQDVFLRVFRSRKSYQATAKFATWLFHIANNVGSNAVRDRSRRHEAQGMMVQDGSGNYLGMDQLAAAPSGAIPTRQIERSERARMVQNAVHALQERQRIALVLSKFEGMSYQEIADSMGMTVKAVKSLLSRARVNLRILLQPYMDEGSRSSGESSDLSGSDQEEEDR
ncbi:MAG: RNA polymerase sigma factor [Pirellulaceae bacterium]